MERTCKNCGKELTKFQKVYCGQSCHFKALSFSKINWSIDITSEMHEIIEGALFSDAGLERAKDGTYPKFTLCQGGGHKDYCDYFANLFKIPLDKVTFARSYYKKVNKYYDKWRIRTRTSPIWQSYYDRWYPNGKKVIPCDFKITPLSLLHAYLGDGCRSTYLANKKYNGGTLYQTVYIATQGFNQVDIENIIVPQLNAIDINSAVYMHRQMNKKTYPNLMIRQKDSQMRFFKFLAENPVRCYDYKFDCLYK